MARIPSISGRYASAGCATIAPLLSGGRCNIARVAERNVKPHQAAGWLVPVERIELPTFGLQNRCSTAELNRLGCAPVYGGAAGAVNIVPVIRGAPAPLRGR